MRQLLQSTAERAVQYLEGLDRRGVAPTAAAIARLSALDQPLQMESCHPEEVLALLDEFGSPATVATTGQRFFGFVIGGSLPAALAASWLADSWDQNAGLWVASPAAATLEDIALRWMVDVLGLPPGTGGGFVTGATMANFTVVAAARHSVLAKVGWDVERDGLFGAPPITVIVGAEAHSTLFKALGLLGLGRKRVVTVPVDGQGRMLVDQLPTISGPTIICAQAGNVNTGAFDPLQELCERAQQAEAWVHVDGAFGLWAATAPRRAHLMAGIALADSWATDAHKWLNVPYDSGVAFVRDPEALHGAMTLSAPYLPQSDKREPSQFTPELSRKARGVEIWAALKSLGRDGLSDLIERNCQYATLFADGLRSAGYAILNDVELNQVLVSFGDPETTQRVIKGIQDDGTCWCGGTVWQGKTAMRISVSSWATTEADVARSLEAMLRVAAQQNAVKVSS